MNRLPVAAALVLIAGMVAAPAAAAGACRITWWQLYYDDSESLAIRYDFVNEHDLLGVGMWRLGAGWERPGYWELLAAKFG
ncbi:MAG TPA: hypothetical protein VM032_02290 [Vicinamibacterales bacterium]|nr:hypothetical protein [Vicinamibacterales bacterium]